MAPLRGAIAEDKKLYQLISGKLNLNVTPSNGSSQTLNALLILGVIFLLIHEDKRCTALEQKEQS
jgi:hypothetical protein